MRWDATETAFQALGVWGNMLRIQAIFLASLLFLAKSVFGQAATFKAADSLRSEPTERADSLVNVASNARAEILERKGFWVKVKTGPGVGWVKLSMLSLEQGSGTSGGSTLAGLATGRTGSGNIVSVSGSRGLSDAELKAAKPDYQALAAVKRSAVSDAEANVYAQAGGLNPRQMQFSPSHAVRRN